MSWLLAKDVVGVTLGMSCVAAVVVHVPGVNGGVSHAATTLGLCFVFSGSVVFFVME